MSGYSQIPLDILGLWPVSASLAYSYKRFGLPGVVRTVLTQMGFGNGQIKIKPAGVRAPLYLRLDSADLPVFDQVFRDELFAFAPKVAPKVIVDAGANIGLGAVYLANRFPEASIIAIEPEKSNFTLLQKNTAPYPNILAVHAALSDQDGVLPWTDSAVPAYTLETIMRKFGLFGIDLLNVNIRGAELEVFKAPAWLARVDTLMVELHERIKPGCEAAVYAAVRGMGQLWVQGARVLVSRSGVMV